MTMREEYEAEARDEFFNDWLNDYYGVVEDEFWNRVAPEDRPLDDELPDYLDEHIDEFMNLAREMFKKWLEEERTRWN